MNAIKEFRKQKKMTQAELADKIGIDRTLIAKYESGVITPPLPKLKAIAEGLNVSIECLLLDASLNEYTPKISKGDKIGIGTTIHNNIQLVLFFSRGVCELCNNNAPFNAPNGFPYLKVKTIQEAIDDPIDKYSVHNLVALCPNCYDKIQVLKDVEDITHLTKVASEHKF